MLQRENAVTSHSTAAAASMLLSSTKRSVGSFSGGGPTLPSRSAAVAIHRLSLGGHHNFTTSPRSHSPVSASPVDSPRINSPAGMSAIQNLFMIFSIQIEWERY